MTEQATAQTGGTGHWRTMARLSRYLWPAGYVGLKVRVVLALASLVAAKGVNVYVPILYKRAVDVLSADGAALVLPLGLIVAYGGARVVQLTFAELRDFIFARVSYHAQRTVALATFRHLHGLSLRFHLDRQTGGLSRVIERGINGVSFLLSFMLFNILPTLVELALVAGILLANFHWAIAAVTVGTIVIYIAFTLLVTDWRLKYRKRMNESDEEANTKAIDSLLNYETVKTFGNETHEYGRYDRALAGYEAAAVKSQTSLSLLNIGQGALIGIGLVVVMGLAGQGVVDGRYTVGDFVLVYSYLLQLAMPLNFLGFVYRQIKQSLVDMDKMFGLLDVPPEVEDATDAEPLRVTRGEVTFENVRFGYGPDRTVLDGVSFAVPPGHTVALVGPSGGGKSTVSRLLFRFYDVTEGAVRIDGQDLRTVTQDSLRAALGIVPQDTVLFNDTIAYNIAYGRPGASREDVERAAGLAQVDAFVRELPQGYDTVVGERGLKLSGGEKQRVAIARTILKDPPVLVLDEATSALDTHTEQEIQSALRTVARDRTTLVIAHRLSTIVDADEILVLQGGRIVERGTHGNLVARDGVYAAMWARQQEAAAAAAVLAEAGDNTAQPPEGHGG